MAFEEPISLPSLHDAALSIARCRYHSNPGFPGPALEVTRVSPMRWRIAVTYSTVAASPYGGARGTWSVDHELVAAEQKRLINKALRAARPAPFDNNA